MTAADDLEALRVALEFRPGIALVDIGLPVIDGYEVAKRFAADARLRAVRRVAVTGYGLEHDRRRSREAGFAEHLVKPIRLERLRQVIESEIAAPAGE